MATTLSNIQTEKMGRVRIAKATLVFSGNYVNNGDALDLSPLASAVGISSGKAPFDAKIDGIAGFKYEFSAGATASACKVLVRVNDAGGANAAQGQHTAIAYVGGVTGDTITIKAWFSNKI